MGKVTYNETCCKEQGITKDCMGYCRDNRKLLESSKLPPNKCNGAKDKAKLCIKTVPSYNETCCQEKGVPHECMAICSDPATTVFLDIPSCSSDLENLIEKCLTNVTGNHDLVQSLNEYQF